MAFRDDELLVRCIRAGHWLEEENRPSSLAFRETEGVSVDLCNDRDANEIRQAFIKRGFEIKALVTVSVATCREKELRVIPKAVPGNDLHVEIHGPENIKLSKSEARHLSVNCDTIFMDDQLS